MVFMGTYEGRDKNWSLIVLTVYLDLGDDRFMEDLQISGPVLGVGFTF